MLKLFVLLNLFVNAFAGVLPSTPRNILHQGDAPKLEGRIIGGTPADITEAPYQVALLVDWYGVGLYSSACGGSIISESVIVSAALCTVDTNAEQCKIRAGSTNSISGGQVKDVLRHLRHEDYDYWTSDYDISLFFLSSPLVIDNIQTALIPLPIQDASISDGAIAIVTGWGTTEVNHTVDSLLKITIPIVNQDECEEAYSDFNEITPRMICAGIGGQDACEGDTGGPLTIDGVLIGITSWGRGCGLPEYPGVWTRVPVLRNWIDSNM